MESRLGQGDGVEVQGRSRQVTGCLRVALAALQSATSNADATNLSILIMSKLFNFVSMMNRSNSAAAYLGREE